MMTEPATNDNPADEDGDVPSKTPLFLFFSCKTSGSSFLKHKLLDIAIHCWPYNDKAPVFYRRINHADKEKEWGKSQYSECSSDRVPVAVCVLEELLQWIDSTVDTASSALGLTLYPVLIAHWGETFQFLFLFRMLEKYGISPTETLAAHDVHFADPVPVLKQYKEARHTWLVDSRSLGIGSLLNDWFPAQFDEADLMLSRSCGALVVKLYTQCPLYWLLYRIPIYNTHEWIEFYESKKLHQENKQELNENIPNSIVRIQRKMTIKQLLKHGYNWSCLIDLYKTCGSPQHFRQELRDMDIKTGAAGHITLKMAAMKHEQDGSREYKVRIKSNMPYAKYYHLTDARGRHFILRVANVLPPCFFSLADLCDNQWQVPDNLLQIGPPDTWDAMLPRSPNDVNENSSEDPIGDKLQGFEKSDVHDFQDCASEVSVVSRLQDVQLEDSSEDEWDKEEDSGVPICENGDLPDCYFKEAAPAHVSTTLVKGTGGTNHFVFPEHEWLTVVNSDEKSESDLLMDEKCSEKSLVSSNQSKPDSRSFPANQITSADLHCGVSANHEASGTNRTSRGTNHRNSAVSRHSAPANQNSRKMAHCTRTNQNDSSSVLCHSALANQSGLPRRNLYSTNQSNWNSCQKNSFTPATNDRRSVRSHDSVVPNERACPAFNHNSLDGPGLSPTSSNLSSNEQIRYRTQGAIPREKRHVPSNCQSKKNNDQSSTANRMATKQSHASTTTNHNVPDSSSDKTFSTRLSGSKDRTHVQPKARPKKKNGGTKTRHESQSNSKLI